MKRGRPPYRLRSASGTPPLTRPRLLPLLPDIYILRPFWALIAVPKRSLYRRATWYLYFPPHLAPCPGCLSYSTTSTPDKSDTHIGSSMLALTYPINASDDHLPSFLSTASGTVFKSSLVALPILTIAPDILLPRYNYDLYDVFLVAFYYHRLPAL